MVTIQIIIVKKVRKNRAKEKLQLEQLKKDYTRWKILNVTVGNIIGALNAKGGEVIVQTLVGGYEDVTHTECIVTNVIRYVNNERIRQLVFFTLSQ